MSRMSNCQQDWRHCAGTRSGWSTVAQQ